jgi:CO/xanthine dehydrogenase FAD-binding subunit
MPLTLHSFATVDEAAKALATGGRYLGGGTYAVRAANEGDLSFDRLIRTSDPAMKAIEISDRAVRLGASVTMAAVARTQELAWLAPAAKAVGGPAIRNVATIGGNLFAPAPFGDFAVALLALGASLELVGRQIDLEEFLAVRYQTAGIVSAVSFAAPAEGAFRFLKVSRIKPKGVSVLSIAACISRDVKGRVNDARIALGCMASHPVRARMAEEALLGAELTEDGVAMAVDAVTHGVQPPSDAIASEWYRREVLPVHFRRLLLQ